MPHGDFAPHTTTWRQRSRSPAWPEPQASPRHVEGGRCLT
jgi:hypothetical protein